MCFLFLTHPWIYLVFPLLLFSLCAIVFIYFSSVQFSCSVMSNTLWPHGLQHARTPCPSSTPGVYPNSCPFASLPEILQWALITIKSKLPACLVLSHPLLRGCVSGILNNGMFPERIVPSVAVASFCKPFFALTTFYTSCKTHLE